MKMKTKARILIVEDDAIMGESLLDRFRLEHYDALWCRSAEDALERLSARPVDLILSDIRLPGMNGRALLEAVNGLAAAPPVILITGYGAIQEAVSALKAGAADYITKPFDLNRLMEKVAGLCPEREDREGFPPLGVSAQMRQLESLLPRVAAQAGTILITGESGVGKERVARRLHDLSGSIPEAPFLAINCAALPHPLLEAELFGHEKGAFTGADRRRTGLFEAAGSGSLFLDEIGELDLSMQAKLLRAVQEREVMPIGSHNPRRFEARLIFATNRNLREEVEQSRFRQDLYYRINVIHLHVPPLRERREDIPWLAQGFATDCSRRQGKRCVIAPQTLEALTTHDWPGNVRELKHAIERACILSDSPVIQRCDIFRERDVGLSETRAGDTGTSAPAASHQDFDLSTHLQRCERAFILEALRANEGRITQTAQALGISRKNLWEKMRRLGLEADGPGH
ncbi:response regulator ArxR [Ectothiorhodospira sp. PHS-1]|uniref:sigma-54-dependent transcriptional regulator n=1 Tax=Ectothiorhodospira sp. PHS-1 TaxID=519989 RepID=UPI00024A8909|nr:response regulator ArxR [Ectothiorhodospira sp. PHS-1]